MNETKYSKEYVDVATKLCEVSTLMIKMAKTSLVMAGISTRAQLMSSDITLPQVVSLAPVMEELP